MLTYFFYNSICEDFLSPKYKETNIKSFKSGVTLKGYDVFLIERQHIITALPSETGKIIGSIVEFKNSVEVEFLCAMMALVGFTLTKIEVDGKTCGFFYMNKEDTKGLTLSKIHGNDFPKAFKSASYEMSMVTESNYKKKQRPSSLHSGEEYYWQQMPPVPYEGPNF